MGCIKSVNCKNYSDSLCEICKYQQGIILGDFYDPIVENLPMPKITDEVDDIMELDRETLEDVISCYDSYIQDANDNDYYSDGWRPVSIQEYYNNEYKENMEGDL